MSERERRNLGEDETQRGLASLDRGVTQGLVADWIVEFVRRSVAERSRR